MENFVKIATEAPAMIGPVMESQSSSILVGKDFETTESFHRRTAVASQKGRETVNASMGSPKARAFGKGCRQVGGRVQVSPRHPRRRNPRQS